MRKPDREKQYLTEERLRAALAVLLLVVLILAAGVLGDKRISVSKASSEEAVRQWESQSESRRILESRRDETAVHEIKLTEGEEGLLIKLTQAFEEQDLEGAARLLNDEADSFQSLFFGKLADKTCLFDSTVMKDKAEGHGLVFRKAGSVFFGDFKAGRPSGQCVALRAVSLEEGVRYDYSTGSWQAGKMEGEGECGYDYYEGVTGDEAKKTVKKGRFSGDLMEGDITYSSVTGDEAATAWSMTVKAGVIVTDERWIPDTAADGKTVYRLPSDTDSSRAYAVDSGEMGEVRWKNMIPWE